MPVAPGRLRARGRSLAVPLLLVLAAACASATRIQTGPPVWQSSRIIVAPLGGPTRVVSYADPADELGPRPAAGRSSVSVEGTVTRDDGTELRRFRERRSSSGAKQLGVAGDQTLVGSCVEALASDNAEMIVTRKYRQAALEA